MATSPVFHPDEVVGNPYPRQGAHPHRRDHNSGDWADALAKDPAATNLAAKDSVAKDPGGAANGAGDYRHDIPGRIPDMHLGSDGAGRFGIGHPGAGRLDIANHSLGPDYPGGCDAVVDRRGGSYLSEVRYSFRGPSLRGEDFVRIDYFRSWFSPDFTPVISR